MPEVVTAARAAQLVGVSEKTMLRWLNADPPKVQGARKVSPVGASARWEIPVASLGELKRLAALAAVRSGASGAASDDELIDLRARVAQLEAEIAALRRRGARMHHDELPARAHPPERDAATNFDGALDLSSGASSDLALNASQGHSRVRRRRSPKTEPLRDDLGPPIGWVAETVFVRDQHGIPLRTNKTYESESRGRYTVTRGERYRLLPRIFATNWLTPEQQAQFHAAFREGYEHALGDPCRVCGWSAARASASSAEHRPLVPMLPRASSAWRINMGKGEGEEE